MSEDDLFAPYDNTAVEPENLRHATVIERLVPESDAERPHGPGKNGKILPDLRRQQGFIPDIRTMKNQSVASGPPVAPSDTHETGGQKDNDPADEKK